MMRRFATIIILVFVTMRVVASDEQIHIPITVDNAHQLTEIGHWQAKSPSITQVEFSPTGDLMAVVGNDQFFNYGSVTFLDPISLEPITMSKSLPQTLAITFSPDGTLFAEADNTGHIDVYQTQNFALYSSIEITEEPILNLAIDQSDQYIAVAIGAGEIATTAASAFQVFDIETGKELLSLKRKTTDIGEIYGSGTAFDNNGQYVYLSTSDGLVHKWNIVTHEETIIGDEAVNGNYRILRISPNNEVVYLTQDGGIRFIAPGGEKRDIANAQYKEARFFFASSMALHPTESLLAISYVMPGQIDAPTMRESLLQLWNSNSGQLLFETIVSKPGLNLLASLAFSPEGTLLASGGTDGTVRLWGIPGTDG